MIRIDKAEERHIDQILEIYEYAREFMRKTGNETQWGTTYPPKEMLLNDIKSGNLYVGTDDEDTVHFVFAYIVGDEPSYSIIEDGAWPDNEEYGTIHRIAGDGRTDRVFERSLEYCKSLKKNIRIDTHNDNKVMQHLIEKNGFKRCGIIYIDDGSARIAYQYNVG